MTTALMTLDAAICAVICLRVLFYRKRGSAHRPIAAMIAWLVVCAAGAVPLQMLLGVSQPPDLFDIVLHAVLCLAVIATGGNVTQLFHTATGNAVYRTIRRSHHAQG